MTPMLHRLAAAAAVAAALLVPRFAAAQASAERGAYIYNAGGCHACHTDVKANGPALAGGAALETPFGTFYAPNISPDPTHGIGRWSDADFLRAMREGIGPGGRHLYPVFPYTAYTKASDHDLLDLKAYLFAQPPVAQPSRPHDLGFPFSIRLTLVVWKWLNFTPGRFQPDPAKDAAVNRGTYLVEALSHCGECHTPRNSLGATDRARWLAGAKVGSETAPNITPHANGLAEWSLGEIAFLLETGVNPEGGAMTGTMSEVVRFGTAKLTADDRRAIAAYLKSLPPLPSAPKN